MKNKKIETYEERVRRAFEGIEGHSLSLAFDEARMRRAVAEHDTYSIMVELSDMIMLLERTRDKLMLLR